MLKNCHPYQDAINLFRDNPFLKYIIAPMKVKYNKYFKKNYLFYFVVLMIFINLWTITIMLVL